MVFHEIIQTSAIESNSYVGLQIALSLMRQDFPWVYDGGVETINILRSRRSKEDKQKAMEEFSKLLEFSFEHPMIREICGDSKEFRMFSREIPDLLRHAFDRISGG